MPIPDRVKEAISFFDLVSRVEADQRAREVEDLAFQTGEGQWDADVKTLKGPITVGNVTLPAEPMLSVSTLDEPLSLAYKQFTDAHLGVNVHPLNDEASDDTAAVLQGLYRAIEVGSRANLARGWAYDRALKAGRGAYRVHKEHDLTTGSKGDQKIVIRRISQQASVYFDPFAQEADWSDGERALEVEDIPWATYKRKYVDGRKDAEKKSKLASYNDASFNVLSTETPNWIGGTTEADRTIRVAAFWYVEHDTKTITLKGANADGSDRDYDEDTRRVQCVVVNAVEVLDSYEWDGQYIPLIPVIGKELQPYDGERRWVGMVHNAKDGVRLTNYAASQAVKLAALEPQALWQMEEGQDAGFEQEYLLANVRKFPVVHWRRGLNGTATAPTRIQTDVSRLGPSMQLLSMGKDFVQRATATYGPSLGEQTPAHRSGEAIKALIGQSGDATGGFLDNLAQVSMTYEAMVILDLIPHIYDRQGRVAKILDEQNRPSQVMLNQPFSMNAQQRPQAYQGAQPAAMPGQQAPPLPDGVKHYDLNKGRYGVTVTIGKSYKSRLEQGNDQMGQLLQAEPNLVPILGPAWLKFQDWPGHDDAAKLLLKMREHSMPWLSDNPQPDPTQQLAQAHQQIQQMQAVIQKQGQALATKQVEQQGKIAIAQLQEGAESDRAAKDRETKIAVAIIQALAKQQAEAVQIFYEERARLGDAVASSRLEARQQAHELAMSAVVHAQAIEQGDQSHQQTMDQSAQDHQQTMTQQAAMPTPAPSDNGSGAPA